jgi:hypothetical protein
MTRLRALYLIVANTALLLLFVETSAHIAIRLYEAVRPALAYRRLSEPARAAYAHLMPAEVIELLRAADALRFRYTPEAGFVEDAMTSRFVNVDAHGIRSNGGGPRDISRIQDAVWFLGGSTALGYGVADHETIPAQLEQRLGRPVTNLAVRAHAGALENRLLNHYLRIGYRPALAIFLDGINETCDTEMFGDELDAVVARAQDGYTWQFGTPVLYAHARISKKLNSMLWGVVDPPEPLELSCRGPATVIPLRTLHRRAMAEREALCALYGIRCLTVVQPFAGVHGRHDDLDISEAAYMRGLFAHLEAGWREAGAIFVTDALDTLQEHAYVDEAHYSAAASRRIAGAIADRLPLR